MKTKLCVLALMFMSIPGFAYAQNKPNLVVKEFSLGKGLTWPYDMKQLQTQTITELKVKDGLYFNITDTADEKAVSSFTLEGEVTEWRAGNRATRMFVGMGAGRETAKMHYWLIDQTGEKVFEHTDTIRQAFWGNAYANSVGQLAQPFADKIADRIKDAKLTQASASVAASKLNDSSTQPVKGSQQSDATKVGSVALTSIPDGAEVYVDGNFVGQTPAVLRLAMGKHTIRVTLREYIDWTRDLSVLESSEVKLTAALEKRN